MLLSVVRRRQQFPTTRFERLLQIGCPLLQFKWMRHLETCKRI